jgi:hypothetical protein
MGLCFISCSQNASNENNEATKEVITKKIVYEANIVNDYLDEKDYEYDWFFENIPTVDLERLVSKLYDDVKSGKINAYYNDLLSDYSEFEVIPEDKIEDFFENEVVIPELRLITDSDGQLVEKDVRTKVGKSYIKRLWFLEEWYFQDGKFVKEVLAVAPVFVKDTDYGGETKNVPYWVLFSDIIK